MSERVHDSFQLATFGGGCFWCLEAVFEQVAGVESVVSGYCGGHTIDPTYQQVYAGTTGHAEVVRICFDPAEVAYEDLLKIFFTIHDPTTLNRQGNDVGTQYRSVIFCHSAVQRETVASFMRSLGEAQYWHDPIVTEVLTDATFYPAEDYHQHYFSKNPEQGYCQMVVAPKLVKFRKIFSSKMKGTVRPDRA